MYSTYLPAFVEKKVVFVCSQTLSLSRQLNDRAFEAQACYSLGSTYTLLNDYSKVIEYHLRHKKLAEELNDR